MKTVEQQVNEWYVQFKRFAKSNGINLNKKEDLSRIRLVFPDKENESGNFYYDIKAYVPNEKGQYKNKPEKVTPEWEYENMVPDESQEMKNYLYEMAKEGNLFFQMFDNDGMGIMVSTDDDGNELKAYDAKEWGEKGTKYTFPKDPGEFSENEPKLNFFVRMFRAISKSFFKKTYEEYTQNLQAYNERKEKFDADKKKYNKMHKVVDAFARELTSEWHEQAAYEEKYWKDMHFLNDEYYKKANDEMNRYGTKETQLRENIGKITGDSYMEIKNFKAGQEEKQSIYTMLTLAYLATDSKNPGKAYKNYTSFVENMMCKDGINDENINMEYSKEDIKNAGMKAYNALNMYINPSGDDRIKYREEAKKEIRDVMKNYIKMNEMLVKTHNGLDSATDFYVDMIGKSVKGNFMSEVMKYGDGALTKDEIKNINKYEKIAHIREENKKLRLDTAKISANYKNVSGKKLADTFSRLIAEKIVSRSMGMSYNAYVNSDNYQQKLLNVDVEENSSYEKELELQTDAPVSKVLNSVIDDKAAYDNLVDSIRNSTVMKKMILGKDAENENDNVILDELLDSKIVDNAGERCEKFIGGLNDSNIVLGKIEEEIATGKQEPDKEKEPQHAKTEEKVKNANNEKRKVM